MDLGERIWELREERGWSQAELSRISGVARTTLTHIETGKNPFPRTPTLRRLARAFGIDVSELTGAPIGPKIPALLPDELVLAPGAARREAIKRATQAERDALLREIAAKDAELQREWSESENPEDRKELWDHGRQLQSLRLEVESAGMPIRTRELVE